MRRILPHKNLRGCLCLVLLGLVPGCESQIALEAEKTRHPHEAILIVYREHTSHDTYAASSLAVFANGTQLGTLGDGQTKAFRYQPVANGTNALKVVLDDRGHLFSASPCEIAFTALAATTTNVTTCYGWGGSYIKVTSVTPIRDTPRDLKQEITENARLLMPSWYREKYFVTENGKYYFNRLHINLLLLGLIFYPLLWLPICCLADLADTRSRPSEVVFQNSVLGLGCVAVTYLLVFLLSLLVWGTSYLVCGLFSDEGRYIPWGFASFSLHLLAALFLLLWLSSLLLPGGWRFQLTTGHPQTAPPPRVRFNYVAMLKAIGIMLVSALVSQIAGWLAGAIVLAIGAGFGIVTSDGDSAR